MKKFLIALAVPFLFAAFTPGPAQAIKKDCFTLAKNEWKECGEKDGKKLHGLELTFKNVCVETMQLYICFDREDGTKDCKWHENVPKDGTVVSTSCNNTGGYAIDACEKKRDCAASKTK